MFLWAFLVRDVMAARDVDDGGFLPLEALVGDAPTRGDIEVLDLKADVSGQQDLVHFTRHGQQAPALCLYGVDQASFDSRNQRHGGLTGWAGIRDNFLKYL